MVIFDNINNKVYDNLKNEIKKGSNLWIKKFLT